MMQKEYTAYVSRFSYWAPGLEEIKDAIECPLDLSESKWLALNPKEFMLFKRRLSRLSKMTIHVLHEILPLNDDTKIVFISFRGEITQQFKINKSLIEENDLSPAAFSQSVFNTAPAAATIVFNLRQGYTALYPAKNSFRSGFITAAAPLFIPGSGDIALIYADELCPPEYGDLCPEPNIPLAFAAILSAKEGGIPVPLNNACLNSPEDFLKFLLDNRKLL